MRRLHVTVGNNWAQAKGYGSRDLLVELTGRPPIYSRRSRAWCTTPHRVPDLVALAEARGFLVTVERDVPKGTSSSLNYPVDHSDKLSTAVEITEPAPVDGLW